MASRDDVDRITGLVEQHSSALLSYFIRRVDDPADAADLLGDLLTVVWRRAGAVPVDETEARMWMFGIASRVLSTQRRGDQRRTALQERLRLELSVQSPRAVQDVADLQEAVGQLPDIDQEIIRLVHWDGFSQAEVAKLLDVPPGTVRSRHLRARRQLRSLLENRGLPRSVR
ncbi:MAG: sigma-70 family RNA polymerase sigma factor [Ilumatobacteraceae bacterium]